MENDYSSSRLFISVQLTRFSVAFFLFCYILSFQVATLKHFILYVTSDHFTSWFLSILDSSLYCVFMLFNQSPVYLVISVDR